MNDEFTASIFNDFWILWHSFGQTNEFDDRGSFAKCLIRIDTRRSGGVMQKWCANRFVFQQKVVVDNAQRCGLTICRTTCAHIVQTRTLRWFTDANDVCFILPFDFIFLASVDAHVVTVKRKWKSNCHAEWFWLWSRRITYINPVTGSMVRHDSFLLHANVVSHMKRCSQNRSPKYCGSPNYAEWGKKNSLNLRSSQSTVCPTYHRVFVTNEINRWPIFMCFIALFIRIESHQQFAIFDYWFWYGRTVIFEPGICEEINWNDMVSWLCTQYSYFSFTFVSVLLAKQTLLSGGHISS